MKVFNTKKSLRTYLDTLDLKKINIGLVPTMGALHLGHISLVEIAKQHCDITIATIFVNPTQFNNTEDLLKYPKTFEEDKQLLIKAGCDVLFSPDVEEMYQPNEVWEYEVGALNTILEGKFRPGHYQGVTQIVYKLFDLVKPDYAFFGQKDYQQFLVISKMAKDFDLNIHLRACPIIREADGLAMSSRNIRLNAKEREKSLQLHKCLQYIKQNYGNCTNNQLVLDAKSFFEDELLALEYLEIVDRESLQPISNFGDAIVLVACSVGATRLIDNMMLP